MFGIILEKLINLIRTSLDPHVATKPPPAVITINTPLITLGGEKLTATVSHGGDTKHGNKSKPTKCDDKISERYVLELDHETIHIMLRIVPLSLAKLEFLTAVCFFFCC
jgi:hypothetical protein